MTGLFFAPFAALQLPLGASLDRWGPRRVTSGLMIFASLGSLLFGTAPSFEMLALGRFLMGAGMAGVLMGGMKAFSDQFSQSTYATATAFMVGIGASGVLLASAPLAWLNEAVGWRSIFVVGALVIAFSSACIWLFSGDAKFRESAPSLSYTPTKLKDVFGSARFWRLALINFSLAGGLLAFQGLWAGPYLADIFELTTIQVGDVLLYMAIGTTMGYFISGIVGDKYGLGRSISAASFIFIGCLISLCIGPPPVLLKSIYFLFGLSGGFGILLLAQSRLIASPQIMGQVISSMNLFGIGGAFILQWWFGALLAYFKADRLSPSLGAYRPAIALLIAINVVSWFVYLPMRKQLQNDRSADSETSTGLDKL
jgi:predicted MFS family arabinose efflux permease